MPRVVKFAGTLGPLTALCAIVVTAVGLGLYATPGRAGDGVCLSAPLDFAGKRVSGCLSAADADALMDRAVKLGDNINAHGVALTHPVDAAQKRDVQTCREYRTAIHEGWYALTTVDMTMESFFKRECGLLDALQGAQMARNSFMSSPRAGVTNLDLVSAQTIDALVPGAQGSIRSLVDAGLVKVEAHGADSVRLSTRDAYATLTEVARGDFDRDGYEDVFALLAVHATGGTMRDYRTILLSRHTPDGMFDVKLVSTDG